MRPEEKELLKKMMEDLEKEEEVKTGVKRKIKFGDKVK
jgi:hypothetical protein